MTESESHGIYVLAGTNGAGKSSILGEVFRISGVEHFNPDSVASKYLTEYPSIGLDEANARAWELMVSFLRDAALGRIRFAFETTLGGRTITELLREAATNGIDVRIWYVALSSAEKHIERVRTRVLNGGHDIPEASIRSRYDNSRMNLISLLPVIKELIIYDNSQEANIHGGEFPLPQLVLHVLDHTIVECCELQEVPLWAKPIVIAALDSP